MKLSSQLDREGQHLMKRSATLTAKKRDRQEIARDFERWVVIIQTAKGKDGDSIVGITLEMYGRLTGLVSGEQRCTVCGRLLQQVSSRCTQGGSSSIGESNFPYRSNPSLTCSGFSAYRHARIPAWGVLGLKILNPDARLSVQFYQRYSIAKALN